MHGLIYILLLTFYQQYKGGAGDRNRTGIDRMGIASFYL